VSANALTKTPAIREVYTWFGAAALDASCLELDVLIILLLAAHLENPDVSEEALAARDTTLDGKSMGQLLAELRRTFGLPDETATVLAEALAKRNFLIHHFWRERGPLLGSPEGCDAMCKELSTLSDTLRRALGHTSGIAQALGERVGIPPSVAAADVARLWKHQNE